MKKIFFALSALALTAQSSFAVTVSDSATITATIPEFVSVDITGGSVPLNFSPTGVVIAATYPVIGGSVALVNNTPRTGDVKVELKGTGGGAPGVLDGPASVPGFSNLINVTTLRLPGISAAAFSVNVNGGTTQNDVVPAFSSIPGTAGGITLNVTSGSAPLLSGAYSGTATVTLTSA